MCVTRFEDIAAGAEALQEEIFPLKIPQEYTDGMKRKIPLFWFRKRLGMYRGIWKCAERKKSSCA